MGPQRGKHWTIEQAIKAAGTQRESSTGYRAGYKSSGPTEGGKHRTIEQAIKVAGPQREASTRQ